MKTSLFGIKKNIPDSKRSVYMKLKDANISYSCGKKGDEEKTSEFTLYVKTDLNHCRLTLNREDAEKVINFWKDHL